LSKGHQFMAFTQRVRP